MVSQTSGRITKISEVAKTFVGNILKSTVNMLKDTQKDLKGFAVAMTAIGSIRDLKGQELHERIREIRYIPEIQEAVEIISMGKEAEFEKDFDKAFIKYLIDIQVYLGQSYLDNLEYIKYLENNEDEQSVVQAPKAPATVSVKPVEVKAETVANEFRVVSEPKPFNFIELLRDIGSNIGSIPKYKRRVDKLPKQDKKRQKIPVLYPLMNPLMMGDSSEMRVSL